MRLNNAAMAKAIGNLRRDPPVGGDELSKGHPKPMKIHDIMEGLSNEYRLTKGIHLEVIQQYQSARSNNEAKSINSIDKFCAHA